MYIPSFFCNCIVEFPAIQT